MTSESRTGGKTQWVSKQGQHGERRTKGPFKILNPTSSLQIPNFEGPSHPQGLKAVIFASSKV